MPNFILKRNEASLASPQNQFALSGGVSGMYAEGYHCAVLCQRETDAADES
jgi:hypothetical protein